jgi:hypothetical protein
LDNIIIYSNSSEEHREHTWLILANGQEACRYLKLSKCVVEMQQISCVGFVVMPEGIEMELDMICMIVEWPE